MLTFGVMTLFAAGYGRIARTGSVREGARYGCCFALLAGLLVDLNQYILCPIPAIMVLAWFLDGLGKFTLCGVIAVKLCPPARDGRQD